MGHGRWPHFVIGAVLLAALGGCGADEPTPPAAAAALPELRAVVALPDEQVARPLLRSSAVHLWPAGTAAEAAEVLCAGDVELALVVGDVPHCAGDGTLAALPIGRLPGVLGAWGRIGGRCVDRPELRVLLRGAEPPTFRALGWRNDARVRITRPALDDPAWRALARWAGVGRPPARLRAADDTVQRRLAKRHPRAALGVYAGAPPKPLWALSIDRDPGTGRDCVAPGPGAVGDGRYPVALPVRLVLRKRDLATPGVADAAGRLVTTPPDRLAAAGLAPPTRAARAKALQRLER